MKSFVDISIQRAIEKDPQAIDSNIFTNFEEYRLSGKNESYLCKLIQKDNIEEFIAYYNKTNFSLNNTIIMLSIFETNSFLIDKKPTLIEYSLFSGLIQIFKFLTFNGVELTPSILIYSIHGKS